MQQRSSFIWAVLLAVSGVVSAAHAQTILNTQIRAPLAGRFATPATGQGNIGFQGTDLGFSFKHGNELRIIYGDSWADTLGDAIGPFGDDTQGTISLSAFPNGDAVDRFIFSHVPAPGDFNWHVPGPTVNYRTNLLGKVIPLFVYQGGATGPLLNMGWGRTPGAGFSNGTNGAFAYFGRNEIALCTSTQLCDGGKYACDTNMGICSNTSGETAVACVKGTGNNTCTGGATCVSAPGVGGGVCRDNTYSFTDPAQLVAAKLLSVVQRERIGNSDPLVPENYYTQVWLTNKFNNMTMRSVRQFTPGGAIDYRPIDGAPPSTARVFMWGRPNWVGAKDQKRPVPLYFAYADLPQYSATGSFTWSVHYLQSVSSTGVPTFTTNPALAGKVSLSGGQDPTAEEFDVVNQMSISFIPSMNKWIMLYGGDIHPQLIKAVPALIGPNTAYKSDQFHAIHARFATNPWGPWSAPTYAYAPGNPDAPVSEQYAAGGMIHDSNCTGSPCVSGEGWLGNAIFGINYGFLYAPNIIDPWTTQTGTNTVGIYWNVSTWDPYETVLMWSAIQNP